MKLCMITNECIAVANTVGCAAIMLIFCGLFLFFSCCTDKRPLIALSMSKLLSLLLRRLLNGYENGRHIMVSETASMRGFYENKLTYFIIEHLFGQFR
jgi:hypothetical protein